MNGRSSRAPHRHKFINLSSLRAARPQVTLQRDVSVSSNKFFHSMMRLPAPLLSPCSLFIHSCITRACIPVPPPQPLLCSAQRPLHPRLLAPVTPRISHQLACSTSPPPRIGSSSSSNIIPVPNPPSRRHRVLSLSSFEHTCSRSFQPSSPPLPPSAPLPSPPSLVVAAVHVS